MLYTVKPFPPWRLIPLQYTIPGKFIFKPFDSCYAIELRRDVFDKICKITDLIVNEPGYGMQPMWRADMIIDRDGIPWLIEINVGDNWCGEYLDEISYSMNGIQQINPHKNLLSEASKNYINVINRDSATTFSMTELSWMRYMRTYDYREVPNNIKNVISCSLDEKYTFLADLYPFNYYDIYRINYKNKLIDLFKKWRTVVPETIWANKLKGSFKNWVFKPNYSSQGQGVLVEQYPRESRRVIAADRFHDAEETEYIAQNIVHGFRYDDCWSMVCSAFANNSLYCLINPGQIVSVGHRDTRWAPFAGVYI